MEIKDKITYVLIAITVIGFFILAITFIHQIRYNKDDHYKELLAEKDSTISAIKENRVTLQLLNDEKDKTIAEHKINDSLAAIQYQKGQVIHNQLNDKANKIPAHIQSIGNNDDSLRSIMSTF